MYLDEQTSTRNNHLKSNPSSENKQKYLRNGLKPQAKKPDGAALEVVIDPIEPII